MEIEMTVKTLIPDPLNSLPIVVLQDRTGERILPIWIGLPEANAILLQIDKVETPRPMTHDLLKRVVEVLGGVVGRIVVSELRDNTFYASIHMDTPRGAVVIDARPSDAIALALRTGSKIFVEERVIESARSVEKREQMDIGRLQKWLENLSEEELGKYKM
jgi:hypothetical protein